MGNITGHGIGRGHQTDQQRKGNGENGSHGDKRSISMFMDPPTGFHIGKKLVRELHF